MAEIKLSMEIITSLLKILTSYGIVVPQDVGSKIQTLIERTA